MFSSPVAKLLKPFVLRRETVACAACVIAALLLAGFELGAAPSEVSIREWDCPTANSRPHDPAEAPDGSLWYTGQTANKLGRVDPKTGQIREYPLRTANSGPHGLVADLDGNIWYTANSAGYIGKLVPQTGEITEYRMPDARASDPHTPLFDRNGILWFTVQGGNFLGKLDPVTGVITLRQSPTAGSRPYGLAMDSQGILFYCENNTNKIGRIDPATFSITEYTLPSTARPRRIAIAPDDIIYYTDDNGTLGRLDPKTGSAEGIPSPSGARAGPYAITATPDGVVWYCETAVQPNNLVRFDPKTRAFTTWPIPSGGGVVRHMVTTKERNLYIACSGVNKVGVVYTSNESAFTIADRGAVSWTTPGAAGSALVGYGRALTDAGSSAPSGFALFGLRQDGTLVTEAAVPAAALVRAGRIYAEVNGDVRTALAIANPGEREARVSFYFTDTAGIDSAERATTIAAGSQIAAFLDEEPFRGGSTIGGTLTFSSTEPVAATALRGLTNERGEFLLTALPVVDTSAVVADSLLLPHFAEGDGWRTEVLLVNGGDAAASGTFEFFGQGTAAEAGQPIAVSVDGRTATTFSYSIASRSSQRFRTAGTGVLQAGSVRVTPASGSRAPAASLVVSLRSRGVTVTSAGVPAVRAGAAFRSYVEASGSVLSAVAVANASSSAATVDFDLTNLDGTPAGASGSAVIPGRGQTAVFLNQIAGLGSLPASFRGVLRISTASAAGVSVTALRCRYNERGDFLVAPTPPVEEASRSSAEIVFPQLVDGAGYTTLLVLVAGAPGRSSSGVLRSFSRDAVPLGLVLR
jgi:virginiamycin B lyase